LKTKYEVEAEEDESVRGLKERLELLTGIPLSDQMLRIRGKIRKNDKTLKQLGLVGGETLQLRMSIFYL
jgi:Ubiquitin family